MPMNRPVIIFCFTILLSCGGKSKTQELDISPSQEKMEDAQKAEAPKHVDKTRFKEGKHDVKKDIKSTDAGGNVLEGSLNWTKGVVRAIGYGIAPLDKPRPVAKLAAREAAYRIALANLLEITKGVNVTATTTVENAMLKSQVVETTIQGVIKGAIILDEAYKEEEQHILASVEVGIVLESIADVIPSDFPGFPKIQHFPTEYFEPVAPKINATLASLDPDHKIIPEDALADLKKVEEILSKLDQQMDKQDELYSRLRDLQEEVKLLKAKQFETDSVLPYTGIVVDAAGVKIEESLYAKICYKEGESYKILYGDTELKRPNEQKLEWVGWAGWVSTMNDAKDNERVTRNPLVVKVIAVGENGEPAISSEDVRKIEAYEKDHKLLEQGKVVFIL